MESPIDKPQVEDKIEAAIAALHAEATNETAAARIFDRALDLIRPYHSSVFWGDRMLTLDKSATFRAQLPFQEAVRGTRSSTGANQYASPDGVTWRFNTLIWAARQALKTPGAFV